MTVQISQLDRLYTRVNAAIAEGKPAPVVTDDDFKNPRFTANLVAAGYEAVRTLENAPGFVLSLRSQLAQSGSLSNKQLRAALNIALGRAADYAIEAREQQARAAIADRRRPADEPYIDLRSTSDKRADDARPANTTLLRNVLDVTPVIPNGVYTVLLNDDGDYRTLRVCDAPDEFGLPHGAQMIKYLRGADNTSDFEPFASVTADRWAVWKRFKKDGALAFALTRLFADPMGAAQSYVLRSKKCFVCNQPLSTPESLRLGIGPVCLKKVTGMGFDWTLPKAGQTYGTNATPDVILDKTAAERLDDALALASSAVDMGDMLPETPEDRAARVAQIEANMNELFAD
jgi:hypothetical protein